MNPDVTIQNLATRFAQIPNPFIRIGSTAPAPDGFQLPMERAQSLLGDLTGRARSSQAAAIGPASRADGSAASTPMPPPRTVRGR